MDTVQYTKEDLEAMPPAQARSLIMKAVKIEGTFVVRDKDGNIKYDDPSLKGTYGEDKL